MHIVISII